MAIEISKHPLIKKIVENNLASTKDVARLIAEEIMRESGEGEAASFEDFLSKFKIMISKHLHGTIKSDKSIEEKIGEINYNHVSNFFINNWKQYASDSEIDAAIPTLGVTYLANLKNSLDAAVEELERRSTEEPAAEEPGTEDPGDGDTDGGAPKEETTTVETNLRDEDFVPLKAAAKEFVENFYEQEFLFQQGKIVKDIMTILIRIMKKDDRKLAVKRPSTEEALSEPVTEEETPKEKKDITSVQNALSSLVRIIKRSKKELKEFHEKSGQAKYGADRVKKQLLKSLQSAQNIIAELIQRLKKFVKKKPLSEGIEDEMLEMFKNIEEVYDNVAPRLEFITNASENSKEVRTELNNQAGEIIKQLHSISHYFPNVNPFKSKDLPKESKEMFEEYELAISALLPSVRDILNELGKDTPVSGVIGNSIASLEKFSGHIQSIFGVESDIPDIAVGPKAPAATEDPELSDAEAAEEPISNREAEELKVATIRDYKEFYEGTVLKLLAGRGEVGRLDEGIEADIKMLESSKKFIEKLIKKYNKGGLKNKQKDDLKSALTRFKQTYETLTGQEKDYGKVVDTKFTDVIAGMRSQQIYDAIKQNDPQMQAVVIRLIPEDKARAVVKLFSNNLEGADFLILTAKIASLSEKPIEAGIITDLQESFLETAKEQPEMTHTDPTFMIRVLANFAAEAPEQDYEQLADKLKNEKELTNALGKDYDKVIRFMGGLISGMIKGDVTPEETKEESEKEIEKEVSEENQEEVKGLISNMIDKLKSFLKLSKDGNQEDEAEEDDEEEEDKEQDEALIKKTPKEHLVDFREFLYDYIEEEEEPQELEEASRISGNIDDVKKAFLMKLHDHLKSEYLNYKKYVGFAKSNPTRHEQLEFIWNAWIRDISDSDKTQKAVEDKIFKAYKKNIFGGTKLRGEEIKDIFSYEILNKPKGSESEPLTGQEAEDPDDDPDGPGDDPEETKEPIPKEAQELLNTIKNKIKKREITIEESKGFLSSLEELGYEIQYDMSKLPEGYMHSYGHEPIASISTNSDDFQEILRNQPTHPDKAIIVGLYDSDNPDGNGSITAFNKGKGQVADLLILKPTQGGIEEQIANKLKPLVKEILRKQK